MVELRRQRSCAGFATFFVFLLLVLLSHDNGVTCFAPIVPALSSRLHPQTQLQQRTSTSNKPLGMAPSVDKKHHETTVSSDNDGTLANLVKEGDNEEAVLSKPVQQRSLCVNGVVARPGPLNEAVVQVLGESGTTTITLQEANELIELGAVWARMEVLSQDEILALYDNDNSWDEDDESSSSARAMYADLPKGWGAGVDDDGSVQWQKKEEGDDVDLEEYVQQMQEQRFRRILTPSWVEAGLDLRIYPNPRRFPACYDMTKENSLLYEDTTFVVVDKPPMLPTQPDASNYEECCPGCVERQLGPFYDILGNKVRRPLLCHRVDSCVGGCVVLSKDRNGQKVFHELQRERKLRKIYKAVTLEPVPTGMHLHWMWAPQSARGVAGGPPCQLVSHALPESRRKARQFWNRCVLEVVKCEPIEIVPDEHAHTYVPEPGQKHYQSTIRLVTGRKHQVRAQLASLGCPILRDTLYEPIAGITLDRIEESERDMDECISRCRVPREPIGLQAAGILFGSIKARAKTPWWGDGVVTDRFQE